MPRWFEQPESHDSLAAARLKLEPYVCGDLIPTTLAYMPVDLRDAVAVLCRFIDGEVDY